MEIINKIKSKRITRFKEINMYLVLDRFTKDQKWYYRLRRSHFQIKFEIEEIEYKRKVYLK